MSYYNDFSMEPQKKFLNGKFVFLNSSIYFSYINNLCLTPDIFMFISLRFLILSLYLISESLCKPQDMQYISGISCSPKKNDYSTIAVWNTDSTRNDYSSFPSNIPNIVFTKSIYEPHIKRKIIGKGKYIAEKPVALSTTL